MNVWIDPDAEQHVVAGDRAPVVDPHALDAAVAVYVGDAMPEQQPHAVRPLMIGEPAPELAAEDALSGRGGRLDDRRADTRLARGGSGLLSDEAGPDHEQAPTGHEGCP